MLNGILLNNDIFALLRYITITVKIPICMYMDNKIAFYFCFLTYFGHPSSFEVSTYTKFLYCNYLFIMSTNPDSST